MGFIKVHRTWPCKMQESYEIRGIFVNPTGNGEAEPKACPLHGGTCPR